METILFSFEMDLNVDIHIDVTNYEPEEEQRDDCPASGPVVEFIAYFVCVQSEYDEKIGKIINLAKYIPVPDEMYDCIAGSVIDKAIENV